MFALKSRAQVFTVKSWKKGKVPASIDDFYYQKQSPDNVTIMLNYNRGKHPKKTNMLLIFLLKKDKPNWEDHHYQVKFLKVTYWIQITISVSYCVIQQFLLIKNKANFNI